MKMIKSLKCFKKENKQNSNKIRYFGIDVIKGIACLSVTYIHNSFPGYLGRYTKAINRFSVLYFFFVSGFFFLNPNMEITTKRIIHKTKHILFILKDSGIFYCIFYICYNLIKDKKFDFIAHIKKK